MLYCSRKCQKQHGNGIHKYDCKKMNIIKNDPSNAYIVVPYTECGELAFLLAFSEHRGIVIPTLMHWEGVVFAVFTFPRQKTNHVISLVKNAGMVLYNDETILVHATKHRIHCESRLQYGTWTFNKHNDWCIDAKALIFMWFLICNRLDIYFPLEIHFEIIPYIVADIRTCSIVRQQIFPLLGQNVWN